MALFGKKINPLRIAIPLIIALIFFAFTGTGFRRAPWYEEAFWLMLDPPARLFSAMGNGITGAWRHYLDLIGVEEENFSLRQRILELERALSNSQEVEGENVRLHRLLSYRDLFPQRTLVARVIANDPRAEFKSITINRGLADGIESLMPVIGPRGLVGKIGKAALHEARVILITDPNSAVDVMVQRSRVRGMAVGAAWHTELKAGYYLTRLEYLRGTSDIKDGDIVVTSGLDALFPPGIPVGTVADLKISNLGVFSEANIVPFEEMAELQEVAVVLSKAEISK